MSKKQSTKNRGGRPANSGTGIRYVQKAAYLEPTTWSALETEAHRLNTTVPELMRTVLRAWLEGMATKAQNEAPNELNRHLLEDRVRTGA